ncbi:transglycosylase domain-containing protein [Pseudomonas sp. BW16M2]|uniref:biosynthetic peptidoglycan transglycosylase n=1 Tax=Pseudomonas sp. BW16M2 TaxID=2745489 RepID=UPI0016450F31|nr:biosynthetic peptidoglycan transglycosylase [Pseudomonas sp. BW16M2]MBC3434006.1 transglycosylase domain-containing protein [Pseudomonas sp. BW16M2]
MFLGFLVRLLFERLYGSEADRLSQDILKIHEGLDCEVCRPSFMVQCALVSAEDHRAYKHPGFDVVSIVRACVKKMLGIGTEGGSTIIQQLVRVLNSSYERTLRRKFKEIVLSCLISARLERSVFPPVYLSVAYFGTGVVGYSAVCKRLGLHGDILSIKEAAMVVARLKYPEPLKMSERKRAKILNRELHIIRLYAKHKEMGYYDFLAAIRPVKPEVEEASASS